jgi:Putative Flp pilus-assembly TadE/G-like
MVDVRRLDELHLQSMTRGRTVITAPTGEAVHERGAVMVIFAISAVMIFAFAAFAVDLAHAFVERRDSQAAVDVAAIGGALTLIDAPANDYFKAVGLVDEVYAVAADNLGAGLDWENCTDPNRPAEFTVAASDVFTDGIDPQYTECISWSTDWSKVRVQLPTRQIDTFFAGVIGFDTLDVNAFAEVGAVVAGNGGVLPFGVLTGGTDGLVCLKTGPQYPAECDPNVSGNFGFLDFRLFGNTAMNTTTQCSGGSVTTLKENIAHGVDHDLATAPSTPIDDKGIDDDILIVEDDEQCSDSSVDVQAVLTETGNKTKVIIDGFVDGINGFPGRLTLGTPTFDYNGTDIDDHGLWEYLSPQGQTLCPDTDTEAEVIACISAHPGTEIFDTTIQASPRLAVVPELWQTAWPTGSKLVSFKSFQFVYLQTLYGGCKNSGVCKLEIEPGSTGTKKVTGDDPVVITAIRVPTATLPPSVVSSFGTPTVVTYALTR